MAAKQVAQTSWRYALARWAFNKSYYPEIGLLSDDTLQDTEDVKEALRRLPEDLYNERNFRMIRALDLSMKKQVLPKDEWVKYEDNVRYLQPYLEEVQRERKEREEWEKQ